MNETTSSNSHRINNNIIFDNEKRVYFYYAYGLGLHSEIFIPEFFATKSTADVYISVDRQHTPHDFITQEIIDTPFAIKFEGKQIVIYLQKTGVFFLEDGKQITIVPVPKVSELLIRYALVGTVMAILLYQRGSLVLHASAININEKAVAFLGNSGEGKSSIAAAFHVQGHSIITDDIAPISFDNDRITVESGLTQIKLSPKVALSLGYNFKSLKLPNPKIQKRSYLLQDSFSPKALPLQNIYVLAFGNEINIELLKPSQGVIELIRHSLPASLFDSANIANCKICMFLASRCCIYRIERPRNLDLLPDLVKLVEKHNQFDVN